MKRNLLKAAAALLPMLAMTPALAQTSLTVTKDADGSVYIRGLAPSSPTDLTFTGTQTTRNVVANSCGGVIIRGNQTTPLPTQIEVGGTDIDVPGLPLAVLPGCVAGAWNVPPTGNFKTPDGRVVIIGQTPNTAIPVTYEGDRVRSATANACGFIRIRSSNTFTVAGSFVVGGQTFVVNDIAQALPPLCRQGVTYLPAT
ncbi:MAG: hypothetical protein HC818_00025 [Synechococcaceae cyanobacterium RM1_1_27]|nr:hypothetical protein [Synechococcaceae cyanobacterium RM1_1_27]